MYVYMAMLFVQIFGNNVSHLFPSVFIWAWLGGIISSYLYNVWLCNCMLCYVCVRKLVFLNFLTGRWHRIFDGMKLWFVSLVSLQ